MRTILKMELQIVNETIVREVELSNIKQFILQSEKSDWECTWNIPHSLTLGKNFLVIDHGYGVN